MADDKKTTKQQDIAAMSFEQAMTALEEIVRNLESGEAGLEEAISQYERGAALKKHCEDKLRSASERVEKIVLNADGAVTGSEPAAFD